MLKAMADAVSVSSGREDKEAAEYLLEQALRLVEYILVEYYEEEKDGQGSCWTVDVSTGWTDDNRADISTKRVTVRINEGSTSSPE